LAEVIELGGAFAAIEELKKRLVVSHTERLRQIETAELTVVGVNAFQETAPSPLGGDGSFLKVDPKVEREMIDDVISWRSSRVQGDVDQALQNLREAAESDQNIMPHTITAAKVGVTTGEWTQVLRDVFGEYRGPTGVQAARGSTLGLREVADRSRNIIGGPPRLLVAKPGLDGHSNGAEQIAVAARDAGMEVIYEGIRVTPEHIAASARDEDVDVIGLSILSGSHLQLVPAVLKALSDHDVISPVVVGGIIPDEDREALLDAGVSRVYTAKDYELVRIMQDLVELVESTRLK
jgi:(2R)-ethylmalonyl-CoA mutase